MTDHMEKHTVAALKKYNNNTSFKLLTDTILKLCGKYQYDGGLLDSVVMVNPTEATKKARASISRKYESRRYDDESFRLFTDEIRRLFDEGGYTFLDGLYVVIIIGEIAEAMVKKYEIQPSVCGIN